MNEINEIQNMLFHGLKLPPPRNVNGGNSILDYFVSRQYIQLYTPAFIKYAFGDLGDKLLSFVDAIDPQHPDICYACNSNFDLKSDFSAHVLEILDVAKLSYDKKFVRVLPILNAALKRDFSKVEGYLSDVERHIRLLKDEIDRRYVRQSLAEKVVLDIAKPDIWRVTPPTFKPYVRVGPSVGYCGFNKITWTNAAIILSKMFNLKNFQVLVKTPRAFSPLPPMINNLIDTLDSFVDVGHRAIFDKFWQIETKQGSVLLGEREKKCYFIICWN